MMKRIAVLFVVLLCVVLAAGAMGCGSKKGDPEQTVKDFWGAMQKGDYATAKTYLASSLGTSTLDEMLAADQTTIDLFEVVMKSVTLKVTGSSVNGDSATVQVEMTMPDMDVVGDALMEAISSSMGNVTDETQLDMEAITQALIAALPEIIKSAPEVTKNQDVSMVWENDAWKINSDLFGDLDSPM